MQAGKKWCNNMAGPDLSTAVVINPPPTEEVVAAPAQMPTYNPEREAGFGARLFGSLKTTPAGTVGLLESGNPVAGGHQQGQVFQDSAGNIILFDPETQEYFPFDSDEFTMNDIADMFGVSMEVGATLPFRAPLAAASAAGGANIMRQALSGMLPGEDAVPGRPAIPAEENIYGVEVPAATPDQAMMQQRVMQPITSAAFGGGGQVIANQMFAPAVESTVNTLRPSNILSKIVQRGSDSPVAKRAGRLEQSTGIEFLPGQKTGARGQLLFEGLVRRHPMSSDKLYRFENRQLDRALGFLDNTLQAVFPGVVGSVTAGRSVKNAFNAAAKAAITKRSNVAKDDFKFLDDISGHAPVFDMKNTVAALDGQIDKLDVRGVGGANIQLLDELKLLRAEFAGKSPQTPMGSSLEMQKWLEVYGKAARGTGQIFKDVKTASERGIAADIFRALNKDVDDAAERLAAGQNENLAQALRVARDNYRQNSALIDELDDSVLGRLIGNDKDPTRVAEQLNRLRPEEASSVFKILETSDAKAAQQLKRFYVEDALAKAGRQTETLAPSPQFAGEEAFSAKKFLTEIRKSPVWSVMERRERANLGTTVRVMERLSSRLGEGSPTAPLQWAMEFAKAALGGGAILNPMTVTKLFGSILIPRKAAEILTNPEARIALVRLYNMKPGTKKFAAAAQHFSALAMLESPSAAAGPDTPVIDPRLLQ